MDKERVKFYSRSDYFYGYMLNKSLEKLRMFDFSKELDSLEEVLELYNIVKYIDDDAESLVVNKEEAYYVRKIFKWYLNGDSMLKIATKLRELNVPTKRGGKWNQSTINSILNSYLDSGKNPEGFS